MQHVFRANFSTSTALAQVLSLVTNANYRKLIALALFVGVSKASGSLGLSILLSKLEHYSGRGRSLMSGLLLTSLTAINLLSSM